MNFNTALCASILYLFGSHIMYSKKN